MDGYCNGRYASYWNVFLQVVSQHALQQGVVPQHALQVVSQHALQQGVWVPRPTPRGEVEESGQGVSRPTPGGCLQVHTKGSPYPHLGGSPGAHPGGSRPHPRGSRCPHPGGFIPACTEADPRVDGYCNGRYASYWNVFLLLNLNCKMKRCKCYGYVKDIRHRFKHDQRCDTC